MTPERREVEIMRLCQYKWYRSSELALALGVGRAGVTRSLRGLVEARQVIKDKRIQSNATYTNSPIVMVYYRTRPL